MRAAIYDAFRQPVEVREVQDPVPAADGVVVEVRATGVCRSDWHGWLGHDADIVPPHVPGHELAGVVVAAGRDVRGFAAGDRVTVPFVCGCGTCPECAAGNQQVCRRQEQPGFTHWGSFAQYVPLRYADTNLVRLPDDLQFATAASLGCRFATSFRAVVDRAQVRPGEWLAVHGCGGVGLSAVMIGVAHGARVVAVDIRDAALDLAIELGAEARIRADRAGDVAAAVRDATGGGAHVAIDALGSRATCRAAIDGLRRCGRFVQVGLLAGDDAHPEVPMPRVLAHELSILGSHGMQAREYPRMLALIAAGRLDPARLVHARVDLAAGARLLMAMGASPGLGVTVIDRY